MLYLDIVIMSGALASAKAKRAGITPPPPQSIPSATLPIPPGVRLSVPQILMAFDSRLNKLETVEKKAEVPAKFMEDIEDIQAKFMILAEEITIMKDIIIKLQSFTMDVNKSLFDERIHIMSDIDENTLVIEKGESH